MRRNGLPLGSPTLEYRSPNLHTSDRHSSVSGTNPDGRLVETVELPGRDFHLGAQFHPEFKSRPNRAHPLFKAFIAAALKFRASEQRSLLHM